jgi:hypothetical protein
MISEPSELDEQKLAAIRKIAESIGSHQPVKRDGLPGLACRNHVCAAQGTIFVTRGDLYRHQSSVAVNDLLSALRFDREFDLADEGATDADMEKDFTFSVLTDLLDAEPAGRSYADRRARAESLSRDGFSTIAEVKATAASAGTCSLATTAAGSALVSIPGIDAYIPEEGSSRND